MAIVTASEFVYIPAQSDGTTVRVGNPYAGMDSADIWQDGAEHRGECEYRNAALCETCANIHDAYMAAVARELLPGI